MDYNMRFKKMEETSTRACDFFLVGDYVRPVTIAYTPFDKNKMYEIVEIDDPEGGCLKILGYDFWLHASRFALCNQDGNIVEDFFV
jgi:hypothetical protein